jgi:hypothetical protein
MATIRLYRRFYKVSSATEPNTYELMDPYELNANTYIKDTNTLIETVSTIQKESTGIYFVDLTPSLYSCDNTYDLKWSVKYFDHNAVKTLTTSFRLNPLNIANEVEIDINQNSLTYEIENAKEFEITII